jgi:hypothetical protein
MLREYLLEGTTKKAKNSDLKIIDKEADLKINFQ